METAIVKAAHAIASLRAGRAERRKAMETCHLLNLIFKGLLWSREGRTPKGNGDKLAH
jgi:hypothetical protein